MTTIYALATSLAKSGVAIIRISGKKSHSTIEALTYLTSNIKARTFYNSRIRNPETQEIIDHILVVKFDAPHSFTGEDVVEFHTHGSRAVIQEIFDILAAYPDLRMAKAGEFTRRAFDNGKLDLLQVEGLADLIDAETKEQRKQAIKQLDGHLSKVYARWREQLLSLRAYLEACLDFPDEEIPDHLLDEISAELAILQQEMSHYLNDQQQGEKLRTGFSVAIIGKANTGKSSLINRLAERDIAIVSDIAGTTRDSIEVPLDINGYRVTIIDTAGIRDSQDVIEKMGIEKAIEKSAKSDYNIVLIGADEISSIDPVILNKMKDNKSIVCVNKGDLLNGNAELVELKEYNPLVISAKSGQGIDQLLGLISEKLEENFSSTESPLITRSRHREHVQQALVLLDEVGQKSDLVLKAEYMRQATNELNEVVGYIGVEDILGKIFSSFCIGK